MKKFVVRTLALSAVPLSSVGFILMLVSNNPKARIVGGLMVLAGETLMLCGFRWKAFKTGELPKRVPQPDQPADLPQGGTEG